ncbi:MAG: hypothetical protein QOG65_1375, partial [Actinomycetota bacterium]|nr:hypothetical protein [Actinomycetota bacterium]
MHAVIRTYSRPRATQLMDLSSRGVARAGIIGGGAQVLQPMLFVAFDVLVLDDDSICDRSHRHRRAAL